MIKTSKTLKGFTLIELLVTISVISVVSSILLISFGDDKAKKELETNARAFAGVAREAQNYALTGKRVVANSEPCRFQVSWGGSSYRIIYWYKNGAGNCNQSSTYVTYELKNGVSFGNSSSFYYTLPFAASSIPNVIAIELNKSSLTHSICAYKDGLILDLPGTNCP